MVTFQCRKCYWVVGIFLLIPALSLFAQQKNYILQTIIDSAKIHLPILAQKRALINSAEAQTKFVRHSFLPSATLADEISINTDNSLPGSYWSLGIIPSTSGGIRSSNNYQPATGNMGVLYSQYDLEDFGLKRAAITNAEAGKNLSLTDLAKEEYMLKWQISKLYFDLIKNQYQLEVDRQNVKRYEEVYKVIQAVTLSGIKPGADSSLALAELSKTRITYNQTLGRFKQIQQQLSYLSGLPVDNIRIDTNQTKASLSSRQIVANVFDSTNNPLTDYYEKQKQLYLSAENLVRKTYLPRIFLAGNIWVRGSGIDYNNNYKSLATGLGYQRVNYMAGVTVSYDLFNGLHKRDKLAVTHFQTQASDEALQQQKLLLQDIGKRADEAIRTAYNNLQEVPIQIKAAQDSYDQKTAQYKAGIINLIDLTNASFVLYRSQTDYVQTLNDWFLANLDKVAATGNLDLFIQSIK